MLLPKDLFLIFSKMIPFDLIWLTKLFSLKREWVNEHTNLVLTYTSIAKNKEAARSERSQDIFKRFPKNQN